MTALTQSISTGIGELAEAITDVFSSLPNAMAATAEMRRLNGLTDAQLEARGLTRADLPKIVFSHYFG
ncbi:MAG: hypothetical protein AAF415_05085 [Pseudomonadota bacterium]